MRSALVMGFLLTCLAAPAQADDHDSSSGGGECGVGCGVATGVVLGIVDVVFLSADLAYGARGRLLPPGWAWGQTLWGGGNIFAGVVLTPLGALADNRTVLGLGIAFGALGTWFFVHGVVSLVKHYRSPRRRYGLIDGTRKVFLPDVSFAPSAGGGYGGLRWTF
jgi:hypothetical protein